LWVWGGGAAGALEENDYTARLAKAGFTEISVEPTRIYSIEDARRFLEDSGIDVDAIAAQAEGKLMSAFIRATKPARSCCGPTCCSN
jgi:hypothetical protein